MIGSVLHLVIHGRKIPVQIKEVYTGPLAVVLDAAGETFVLDLADANLQPMTDHEIERYWLEREETTHKKQTAKNN